MTADWLSDQVGKLEAGKLTQRSLCREDLARFDADFLEKQPGSLVRRCWQKTWTELDDLGPKECADVHLAACQEIQGSQEVQKDQEEVYLDSPLRRGDSRRPRRTWWTYY